MTNGGVQLIKNDIKKNYIYNLIDYKKIHNQIYNLKIAHVSKEKDRKN